MPPSTWETLGFDQTADEIFPLGISDEFALKACQEMFADHLDDHPLVGNNSKWLQFPTIKCERWHHENVVLMGDAIHTAHFSVGSGTKLAMEDAIALSGFLLDDMPIGEASTPMRWQDAPRSTACNERPKRASNGSKAQTAIGIWSQSSSYSAC